MAEQPLLRVEVVAAWPRRIWRRSLQVPAGTTVASALAGAGLAPDVASLVRDGQVGIFGSAIDPRSTVLADGDRIEIYRPLQADPREARRARTAPANRRPRS